MAECVENILEKAPDWSKNAANLNEQKDEIEALRSFYENTDNLDIINEACDKTNMKYSFQIKVPVETPTRPINVELWLPIEHVDSMANEAADGARHKIDPNLEKPPKLERSISGKRAHTTIKCEQLTPIIVDVELPDGYPTECAPFFRIYCDWLSNSQLKQICSKLDEIWHECEFMPVLFTWFDWIKSNLVEYLDLFIEPNKIIVTPLNNEPEESADDQRFQCMFNNSDDFIYKFLSHNYIEEIKQFRNSVQSCMICFEEKMGSEFYRLNSCKHHFCGDCLTSMCQLHVKEGTIQLLKCPCEKCTEFVPIDVMSKVLSHEEFERWDRLSYQRTLDSMEDVIYCPKCSNPIIVDNVDSHAYCFVCKIDFCKSCKETWHTGECENGDQKIEQKVKNLNISIDDLVKMTDNQIKARFKDANYVMKLRQKTQAEVSATKNFEALKKYLRCPDCKNGIEKIDGCNKVTCHCGCIICYICGKKITGYDHFNDSKCNLWSNEVNPLYRVPERPRHEAQIAMERILQLVPEQRRNIINCTTCGQINLKVQRNNHIKCWLCKTNVCFECKKKIIGNVTSHYILSNCKQHS